MVWREGKGREEYRYVTSIIIKVITTHTHTHTKKKKTGKANLFDASSLFPQQICLINYINMLKEKLNTSPNNLVNEVHKYLVENK